MSDPKNRDEEKQGGLPEAGEPTLTGAEIAVVGMACRFPGAVTVEKFWSNLCDGVESLTLLGDEELLAAGVDPRVSSSKHYVRRAAVLDDVESFDADFFGYTPLEARVMDPQHRLFLECAWEALERAGYDPAAYDGAVGVFTGAKTNTYLLNLFADQEFFGSLDSFQVALGNDLACMATRVSYKFGLTGPSYAVHTACSTSLVAVHLACQSLLIDECRMALAGGAAVNVPQKKGYLYQPGGILSPDGSCRTFDAQAAGSNFGNGAGCVLLKRLEDALEDGDHVHAVIKGTATNNDGAAKASFTAPGVVGQTNVILEALACAGVDADSLSYIEAHGTATNLGDSIEMLALNESFRASTQRKGFCALGSVKTNLGHLETAAGVAGLIKTAMALEHRSIPPSLNFEVPNPKIDFESSPFYVNTALRDWPQGETPRRAGLSSFGIGSTNAHAILEEAPPVAPGSPSRDAQLLLLSARTATALEAMTRNLAEALERSPDLCLADAAYTLQAGRRRFEHRRAVVVSSASGESPRASDAAQTLKALAPTSSFIRVDDTKQRPVAFLLPGLGDQQVGLARGLYETEATFRELLDRCAALLERELGEDLRTVLYPQGDPASNPPKGQPPKDQPAKSFKALLGRNQAAGPLDSTARAQPALFAVELCLARQWMEWGVDPQALIGYSLGEYVAACLAGVLSLEDALTLVARRARLIEELPTGAMLAVSLAEEAILPRLGEDLSLAAVNGPELTVVAGSVAAVEALAAHLEEEGIACRRLATTHAFHSSQLAPVVEPLESLVRTFRLSSPEIPYISNVTGTWITAEEATDPSYWARHMVRPVRFSEGVAALLEGSRRTLLEMGTGQSLASFVKVHPDCSDEAAARVFASLPGGFSALRDVDHAQLTLGKLWATGVDVDWAGYYRRERRLRVPLPTYPFERQRHWVDGVAALQGRPAAAAKPVRGEKKENLAEWFYVPTWRPEPLEPGEIAEGPWLLFLDDVGVARETARQLREQGQEVVTVVPGMAFRRLEEGAYALPPRQPEGYSALLKDLGARGWVPAVVLHAWGVDEGEPAMVGSSDLAARKDVQEAPQEALQEEILGRTFYSVLGLLQALGRGGVSATVGVVTTGVQRVEGSERLWPEKATVLGPVKVAPQELAGVTCRAIDITLGGEDLARLARVLIDELSFSPEQGSSSDHRAVAYRDGARRVEDFEKAPLEEASREQPRLREGGTYLITGGLGGVGRVLAGTLARDWKARLVLTRRSPLPPRDKWQAWLLEHEEADPTSAVLRDVLSFEEAGAEVLVVAADVADKKAMGAALEAARARFGSLHGVLHAAGVGGGGLIQLKSHEEAAAILAPKVRGTRVLESLLAGEELDFLMLFSSLQSVLGDFGQADYCGANAFLDAFAESRASTGAPWVVAVGWDNWQEVGIAVNTEMPPHLQDWQADLLSRAITSQEGARIFERVLGADVPRLVVTTQELSGRLEESRYYTSARILQEFGGGGSGAALVGSALGLGRTELEQRVAAVWQGVLGKERVGLEDNFFDLGGNSLLGMQLINRINQELGTEIPPVTLFEAPTVSALVAQLAPEKEVDEESEEASAQESLAIAEITAAKTGVPEPIAIIGMSGRFPGADDLQKFWSNLRQGVDSTHYFTDEELLEAGVDRQTLDHPTYVKARPILSDVEHFDAELFALSPREAETMDPQHRLFLECAWEALETAACDPDRFPGRIGVYAGCAISTYLLNLHSNPELMESVGTFQTMIGNEKDSMPTRVSYKLNLTGPSVAVQTFCSTSLVAVHMACRSLRDRECDVSLAGGVSVHVPQLSGYHYQEGGFVSSDGRVKAFDASADGFTFGNGVAVVVLKRLSDALRDGDPVRAVIKASAVNNDGSLKVGYTATSVEGQSQVIADALEAGGISADSVGYVETHGTGTRLGDPVEIAALTKAFRRSTDEMGVCPIGSVKTNIGHLDRAAGATGLIKAVLTLEHEEIPPTLHLAAPNPEIDFASSPFFVNTRLRPWARGDVPRRAGVNSLGLGGTNAHVVLEEAPPPAPSGPSRPWQLLLLSSQTPASLEGGTERLRTHLEAHPEASLADVAFTLQQGRRFLRQRRFLVARDGADAIAGLGEEAPKRCFNGAAESSQRRPVFLFPGLGGQYVGMGRGLYEGEEIFRQEVDRCAEALLPELGVDLREVLYPAQGSDGSKPDAGPTDFRKMLRRGNAAVEDDDPAEQQLRRTRFSQPALFVVEYALARLWLSWGVKPRALAGYSIGEYVAACLAGVLTLDDALKLVARRAKLIEDLPCGAMLAVGMSEENVGRLLGEELSLAAVNGPEQSVVAGTEEAVAAFEERLVALDVISRRLQVTHAFHSPMLRPIFEDLVELVKTFTLEAPRIPVLSNVTGTWLTAESAVDPTYWARHMIGTVRFSEVVTELAREAAPVLLEVGPQALSSLVLQHPEIGQDASVVGCLRHAYETRPDQAVLLEALGKLWLSGVGIDWRKLSTGEQRRRLVLPTYAFDRKRYWVERQEGTSSKRRRRSRSADGFSFSVPGWRRVASPAAPGEPRRWWVLGRGDGIEEGLREALQETGCEVVSVRPGKGFEALEDGSFIVDPGFDGDFVELLKQAAKPEGIAFLWALEEEDKSAAEAGFSALLRLGRAFDGGEADLGVLPLWAVGAEGQEVIGNEALRPDQLALFGAAAALAREGDRFAAHVLDLEIPRTNGDSQLRLGRRIAAECQVGDAPASVAFRGRHRWLPSLDVLSLGTAPDDVFSAQDPAFLVLNGLGALGYDFTSFFGERPGARLVLVEGAGFPAEEQWQEWLENDTAHGLVSRKIERIQELRQGGAEVEVAASEAGEEVPLGQLLVETSRRLGGLGAVVAVFEPEGGDPAVALASKRASLLGLEELAKTDPPAVGLLVTTSSFAGQPASAADAAAGLCLDAFASVRSRAGEGRWTSVVWDLAADSPAPPRRSALERLIAADLPAQLVVSAEPLEEGWTRLEAFSLEAAGAQEGFAYYSRPGLNVEFVAPRSPVEQTIAEIWQELLGVDRVGVYDNFLDLGGDSLLATRLISRMRDAFHLDFPIRLFFEASTVEELGEAVVRKQGEQEESDLEELMSLVDGMSEEELEAELARHQELAETEA